MGSTGQEDIRILLGVGAVCVCVFDKDENRVSSVFEGTRPTPNN